MPITSYVPSSAIAKPGVCTSSTRPASPYEGQVIYTTDTDLLQIWNGTAWRTLAFATPSSGSILQVQSNSLTSQVTLTTSTAVDTGIAVSITPTSTTSKILVRVALNGLNRQVGDTGLNAYLYRGATNLTAFAYQAGRIHSTTTQFNGGSVVCDYVDSPASTAALTYTVYASSSQNTAYAIINHSNLTTSSITVMEIAA